VVSGCLSFVTVVKSSNFRHPHHVAELSRLNASGPRRVLVQRQMGAEALVVVEVGFEDAVLGSFVENNDVIQTLPPGRPNQSLNVRIGVSHQLQPMETLMLDVSE